MRRLALPLVLVLLLTSCAQPGEGGYLVSASFPRAAQLFEDSRVKVMGLDVGHVEDIAIDGERIRVDLRVDRDVPLPVDVEATIMPLSLIGERNVVLSPPWQPGDEEAGDGHRIAADRSHVTAEPDDVLDTVMDVTTSLDAEGMGDAVRRAADALDGHGQTIHEALGTGARVARLLREQDDDLLAAAEGLTDLATTLNRREAQLRALTGSVAEATDVLAAERDQLRPFLAAVADLVDEGGQVLAAYEGELAADLASLARIARVLELNTASVARLVAALPPIAEMLLAAYRPDTRAIKLRFTGAVTGPTVLNQILGLLGLPPVEDCVAVFGVACEDPS